MCVGHPPDSQQDLVGVDSATFATGRETHLQRTVLLGDLGDLAVGVDLTAQTRQMLRVHGNEVGIDHRQDLRQHLEHRDLAAEGREHRRELHPYDATADHRQAAWDLLELEELVGVDGQLSAGQRDASHRGPGGDDDVLRLQLVTAHVDQALPGEAGAALERCHAAGLEQPVDALDELVDD